MNYQQVTELYEGCAKAAAVIGVTRQGLFRYKNMPLPIEWQIAFEVASEGKLKADLPEQVRVA